MNVDRLIAHYERIADAPDAIARLRHFILDLAVRGKLMPQDPKDEPASELLKRTTRAKSRDVKTSEQHPQVPENDANYAIPNGWAWTTLGKVTNVVMGQSPPGETYNKSGEGVPLINGPVEFTAGPFGKTVLNQYTTAPTNFCEEGDLLICVRGSTTGRTNVAGFRACIGRGVAAIRPHFDDAFIRLFIWKSRDSIIGMGRGIAFPSVSRQQIEDLAFSLPPLAEQHRIVAKVDELMALCDRLEAARALRETTRDRLAASSVARLNAPDPETFQADARFVLNVLPALTMRPDQIKQLRQTILNLAVRGKLVPQDPNDEPAAELVKRIAKERAELIIKKEIRREDALDPIQSAEMPFGVPATWVWSRIGDAVLFTQYGTSQKSNPSEKGIPVLTMGNIQDGIVVWNNEKRIPETSEDLPALFLRKFDLLYNRTNSAELVGKTGIYLGDTGVRTFASYLIRLRPSLSSSDPCFINMAMNTPEFRETQIVPLIKKQTGQANVNGTALKNMLIPIPPLAEQHRIVAKVDALMALCGQLEARLTAAAATRRRLLDALLAEALAPAEDREMEAAE